MPNPLYALTLLGDPYVLAAASIVLVVSYFPFKKMYPSQAKMYKRFLCVFLPALYLSFASAQFTKQAFQVERPCFPCTQGDSFPEGCNIYCDDSASFFSGHAVGAFAAWASLIFVLGKKRYLPLFALPLLVSASRVWLGVHTVVDVSFGSAIGLMWAAIFYWLEEVYELRDKKWAFG